MIANFQSHKIAVMYRNWLWGNGHLFASLHPYRGGWQVFTSGIRVVVR